MNCARCGVKLSIERDAVNRCERVVHPPLPDVAVLISAPDLQSLAGEEAALIADVLHDPDMSGSLSIPFALRGRR